MCVFLNLANVAEFVAIDKHNLPSILASCKLDAASCSHFTVSPHSHVLMCCMLPWMKCNSRLKMNSCLLLNFFVVAIVVNMNITD